MHFPLFRLGALVAVTCGLCAFAGADAKSQQTLNPAGQLKGFKAGESARYVLWHSKNGWHIRTTTAKKEHHFTGKIHVEGGTFTNVASHDLEFKGKFGDWWKLHEKRHEITINFKTSRGIDGIDFQVNKEAKSVHFNLHIDGLHQKNLIFVGRDGQHPDRDPFVLPAHP